MYSERNSFYPQKLDAMDAWFTAAFVMIIEDLQSLQEPTEEREVEIIDEMKKLKSSLDKLKSMWLSVTYNTYYSLIEELRENNIILA